MKPHHLVFAALLFLVGCWRGNDSGVVWRGGPYILSWMGTADKVSVCYQGTPIVRIDVQVVAVGWDGHYLVVKQHPDGNKAITNYYFIDATKDGPKVDPMDVVVGPLSELEFAKKSAELHLPPFSKELGSLK